MSAALVDDNEGEHGTEGHQSLDPEVEDAGALGHQLAKGCQKKRCRSREHAGKNELDGVHDGLRWAARRHSRR